MRDRWGWGRRLLTPLLVVLPGRLGPFFSDEAGFVQACVGGLPFPVNLPQFLAVVDQERPKLIQYPFVFPAPHRPMHGGIAAELFGQPVPLAAGARTIDHGVQAFPLVGARSPHARRRVQFTHQGQEEVLPHRIRDLPDGGQCFSCLCRFHEPIVGTALRLGVVDQSMLLRAWDRQWESGSSNSDCSRQ